MRGLYFGIATTFMCVFFLGKRFDSLGVVWAWYGFDFVAIWFWSVGVLTDSLLFWGALRLARCQNICSPQRLAKMKTAFYSILKQWAPQESREKSLLVAGYVVCCLRLHPLDSFFGDEDDGEDVGEDTYVWWHVSELFQGTYTPCFQEMEAQELPGPPGDGEVLLKARGRI